MLPNISRQPEVHVNLNVRGMEASATLAINQRCREMARQGREVFRLGLGQSPFPVPAEVVEELQTFAWRKEYQDVRGLAELREAVAKYHSRRCPRSFSPDDVLIGPGSKELMFILQIVYYGEILIPTPAWVSYAPQARIVGRTVSFLPTDIGRGWKLSPEDLAAHCQDDPSRPRVLILTYPSNPTGATYTESELKQLAEVAERHQILVLSDEIYAELEFEGVYRSIAPYYPQGTIISSGLSKWCGAGGWRLGTFTFPPGLNWLQKAMAAVASESFTSTSTPIQCAAVRAFQGGPGIEAYLASARAILGQISRQLEQRLRRAGATVVPASGGFYLFPDFEGARERLAARGIRTSRQLALGLLEQTGVAVLPGADFGRAPEELTLRLAFVDFDGTRALLKHQAGEAFDESGPAPRVVEAIDRLTAWVFGH